jgi:hypothetical protein
MGAAASFDQDAQDKALSDVFASVRFVQAESSASEYKPMQIPLQRAPSKAALIRFNPQEPRGILIRKHYDREIGAHKLKLQQAAEREETLKMLTREIVLRDAEMNDLKVVIAEFHSKSEDPPEQIIKRYTKLGRQKQRYRELIAKIKAA